MRNEAEQAPGWRLDIDVDGRRFTAFADHRTVRRMPRGHELARQITSGRPVSMVQERTLRWGISDRMSRICTLEATDNGGYRAGWCQARPGTPFLTAIEGAIRMHARLPGATGSTPPPGATGAGNGR